MSKIDATTTVSAEFGIFGIPMDESESRVVLIPVPWEVTTSYGAGTSQGPQIIRGASEQIDLFDLETGKAYEQGFFMRQLDSSILEKNQINKAKAQELIEMRTNLSKDEKRMETLAREVNQASSELTQWVFEQAQSVLKQGKLLGLVGGDHSTPLGAIRAVCEKHSTNGISEVGVLHIDAHADLRNAYQGFEQSHASIMYNVMTLPVKPKTLVQVGIRDFCEEEYDLIQSREDITTHFDIQLKRRLMEGETWSQIARGIVESLPKKVFISFDIDGLDPKYCPHTGTPVPGGLEVDQVFYLFKTIAESGRQIVGFDLNEVSPGESEDSEWDGNVGARMLYKLCGWSVVTNSKR